MMKQEKDIKSRKSQINLNFFAEKEQTSPQPAKTKNDIFPAEFEELFGPITDTNISQLPLSPELQAEKERMETVFRTLDEALDEFDRYLEGEKSRPNFKIFKK